MGAALGSIRVPKGDKERVVSAVAEQLRRAASALPRRLASAGAAQGNASDSVRALLKAAAQPQGFGAAQCSCLISTGERGYREARHWVTWPRSLRMPFVVVPMSSLRPVARDDRSSIASVAKESLRKLEERAKLLVSSGACGARGRPLSARSSSRG